MEPSRGQLYRNERRSETLNLSSERREDESLNRVGLLLDKSRESSKEKESSAPSKRQERSVSRGDKNEVKVGETRTK